MSFTKVAPAGIGTEPGTSILIGDSLLHSTGIDIGSNTGIGVTIRKHGDATFTGIVTAASFSGSGANLTGIDATAIKHTDGNVKVQATGTGANLTGNLSVSGNLGGGGVLTYEDVTNIDSVGVITARSGIKIGPTAGVAATIFSDGSINTTGIVTATTIKVGTAISITDSAVSATRFHGDGSQLTGISQVGGATGADFNDDTKLRFGGSNQLEVYYGSSKGNIKVTSGQLEFASSGNITAKVNNTETAIHCAANASVDLYHNGTKQCETSANGLAFPNGKGIDFSATSNTSATGASTQSELLDDYEEGTWTPTPEMTHVSGTPTFHNRIGTYTKIGRQVFIQGYIHFNSISYSATNQTFELTGLPFNAVSSGGGAAGVTGSTVWQQLEWVGASQSSYGTNDDVVLSPKVAGYNKVRFNTSSQVKYYVGELLNDAVHNNAALLIFSFCYLA